MVSEFSHILPTEDSSLFALSPLDGRYKTATQSLRKYFSEVALIQYRVYVEAKWLLCLSRQGLEGFPKLEEEDITWLSSLPEMTLEHALSVKELEKTINHDLKAVEYFIKERIESSGRPLLLDLKEFVHFACTSEDVNNLARSLMLKHAFSDILRPQMIDVLKCLGQMARQWSDVPMLSLTHGQPATPTTVGKEMGLFGIRLLQQLRRLDQIELKGKINGASGNFNSHIVAYPNHDWPKIAASFVSSLGLSYQPYSTQIECHDHLAERFDCLSRFQTILIGACQDIWTYISRDRFKLKVVDGEVGSSTMPHKVNPIDFENAEGNFGLSNALLKFMVSKLPISRMQRDLSDSTVLRNVGSVFGYSVIALQSTKKGLNKIDINKEFLSQELDQHTEVLAEPIQTVLRKDGIPNAYEKLKKFTRATDVDKDKMDSIISDSYPTDCNSRTSLIKLTPSSYIGNAPVLAIQMADEISSFCQ